MLTGTPFTSGLMEGGGGGERGDFVTSCIKASPDLGPSAFVSCDLQYPIVTQIYEYIKRSYTDITNLKD